MFRPSEYGVDRNICEEVSIKLEALMNEHQWLGNFGVGVFDSRSKSKEENAAQLAENRRQLRLEIQQIIRCSDWLVQNIKRTKQINSGITSYGMKHIAEQELGYVSNGVLIASALLNGYRHRATEWPSPNLCFNMSRGSWRAAQKRVQENSDKRVWPRRV